MFVLFNCLVLLTFTELTISSDFSLKGDPCSKFDSCSSKTATKTCSCDSDCHSYGTCCHDARETVQDIPDFQCYSRRTVNPVFVKRSCAKDFRGHDSDRLACFDDDEDEMDVRNNLLVTSRNTRIAYWNKHCAICNNEVAADLVYWNIDVLCPPHKEVSRRLIRRNLTFDQDLKQWGLKIGEDFLQCIVKYSPPAYMNEVKHCTPNIVVNCPENYTNEGVSAKCSEYYAERKLKDADIFYKNIHCAICNGADITHLECPGMSGPEDIVEESDFREMIEEIFTSGEWLEKEPGKQFECSKGFAYDPARAKCRSDELKEKIVIEQNSSHTCSRESSGMFVVLAVTFLLANML